MASPPFRGPLLAGALAIAAFATAAAAAPPPAAPPEPAAPAPPDSLPEIHVPRWIFAVEDTLDLPATFEMSTLEVRAERLGIGEIVDRCIRSEQELHDRIESLEQTVWVKQVYHVGGYGEDARERLVQEQVDRMIYRRPDVDRSIPLKRERYKLVDGKREPWDPEDEPTVKLEYGSLSELPFYLEDRDAYDFSILSRRIVGDHVLYEVRLAPRSDFEIAPTGTIWVDASSFRILREEFDFGDRVPLPMFVKRIGPFVRERVRVGDLWVWSRMLIRVDVRTALLKYLDRNIPETVEFVVTFRDFRVNEPPSDEASADDASSEGATAGEVRE
jgi:hypothetical protein